MQWLDWSIVSLTGSICTFIIHSIFMAQFSICYAVSSVKSMAYPTQLTLSKLCIKACVNIFFKRRTSNNLKIIIYLIFLWSLLNDMVNLFFNHLIMVWIQGNKLEIHGHGLVIWWEQICTYYIVEQISNLRGINLLWH